MSSIFQDDIRRNDLFPSLEMFSDFGGSHVPFSINERGLRGGEIPSITIDHNNP